VNINSTRDLGALIRSHRKKRNWTQKDLAEQVGVRTLWISQFERGKTTAQIGLVIRTLKALGLTVSAGNSRPTAALKKATVDLDSLVQPQPDAILFARDPLL